MKTSESAIAGNLERLKELAPAGYALGFHISFTTPRFMFQTYPKEWLDHYNRNGLIMKDPTVKWGFDERGTLRWSEMEDPYDLLTTAAEFGLAHGMTVATEDGGSRSIGGFARSDRPFEDAEMAEVEALVLALHEATHHTAELDEETVNHLRRMSILVTHPGDS